VVKPIKQFVIIDDEASMRKNILDILKPYHFVLHEACNGKSGLNFVISREPEIILLDINLPDIDGLSLLREIKKIHPSSTVIVFTAYGTSERAISAMKEGAFDYLEKPFDLEEFLLVIKRAVEYHDLVSEVVELKRIKNPESPKISSQIVSHSPQMQEIFKTIGKLANNDVPVLIYGESGTGKELIANAIQEHSARSGKPYIKLNCSSLSENLLESEIFGHEKGAFTGALTQRAGRFELADGGTLLLDEINSMPLSLQVKLLRVLQHGEFERVGGEKTLKVNVRVISATNQDLQESIDKELFRKDLYYRLNVVRINVPPLRERIEDIEPLVQYFIKKYSPESEIVITDKSLNVLRSYDWPGNVRELENVIHRALIVSQSNVIDINSISEIKNKNYFSADKNDDGAMDFKSMVARYEKKLIYEALCAEGWNKSRAAQRLKIQRRLLYAKIAEYNIHH